MALLGNISLLHKSPAKYTTGTVGFNDRANWNKPGMMRSRGDLTISALWQYDAIPSGMYAGRAFFAPTKAGRIVTRTNFEVNADASGALGAPSAAMGDLIINGAAVGGLLAGGVANATITVNAIGNVAGLVFGQAIGDMQVIANAVASAMAFGVAQGEISVYAQAQPSALGFMQASTVDNTTLTLPNIAEAVWAAIAAQNNLPNTMGAQLNAAGAGGDPWASILESGLSAADILRVVLSAVAGKREGIGGPVETYYGQNGTTIRIEFAHDANNNGTPFIDGAL